MKNYSLLLALVLSIPFHLYATDCNEEEIPIIITVITADFGSDTFWELTNDVTGEQYGTSGFFLVDNTTYIDTLCVPDGSQLTFTVSCCVNNMGSYKVEMLGVTIAEQGNFQFQNQISFIAADLPELDAELSAVDLPDNLLRGPQIIAGKITNLGSTTIQSLDVNWRLGNQTFTHNIEGLQLQAFEEYHFVHEQKWQATTGTSTFIVFISNINGSDDNELSNNSKVKEIAVHNTLSERTILYESFTNASCSICVAADPNFTNTVLGNPAIAAISYHSNFPGFDPMYDENPSDVDIRLQHHEVFGVPRSVIEGGLLKDGTQFILSSNVNAFRATDALINITLIEKMVQGMEGESDKVVLEVYLTPTATIESPNLLLQTAIVEREVVYEDSPGTNGQTVFYYVMRKLLPNANGTPLSNLEANVTQRFSFEYEAAEYIKNREELRSVVFVEDSQTNTIFQALRNDDVLGENLHSNLQKLGANFGYIAADIQHNRCNSNTNGQIAIEAFGETDNLQFLWSNGTTETSISNLEAGIYGLQITTMNGTIEEYSFEVFAPESFSIEVSSTPDMDAQGIGSAGIEIIEGQAPFSFQWSTGESTPTIEGKTSGVYNVTITDAFGCHQTAEVVIDAITDIEGFADLNKSFFLYPNPAKNQISLQWKTAFSENVELRVFNILGEKIHTFTLDSTSMGTQTVLDISGFEAGVYLLQGSIGGEVFSKRFYVLQ
ncbi:MAG: T9SS type A sorting domain-containing protein [Chitinophagales bacterium]